MRKGMTERQYAAHLGMSRGAVKKAKATGRLDFHEDGSINQMTSDKLYSEGTDPSKSQRAALKAVPDVAVEAVNDTLREQGLSTKSVGGGGTTFLQAKTAHEVLKAQERRIKLQKLKGELVDKERATALVFRLAREERDAWLNWPARVSAVMASKLNVDAHVVQQLLETHVREHLAELAEIRPDFR